MKWKELLAYTNPITIIAGIPILIGVMWAIMLNNLFKDTKKVLNSIEEDLLEAEVE